jgi:hypothetical protein
MILLNDVAIATTERNSRPFARCMVLIETPPVAASTFSSSNLKENPLFITAASGVKGCVGQGDLTKGRRPILPGTL